jgi:hypothetical protein
VPAKFIESFIPTNSQATVKSHVAIIPYRRKIIIIKPIAIKTKVEKSQPFINS